MLLGDPSAGEPPRDGCRVLFRLLRIDANVVITIGLLLFKLCYWRLSSLKLVFRLLVTFLDEGGGGGAGRVIPSD